MKIKISPEKSGERLDKFLMREVFFNGEISRGEAVKNIKAGGIFVNGKNVKPSYVLKEGDEIEIQPTVINEQRTIEPDEKIKINVLYQDKNIIVVDKPAYLQIHPSSKGEEDTLVNGLLAQFPEIETVGDEPKIRPGIVHRLDRDTSGLLIVARNQEAFLELKRKFKDREVFKKYWTLVYGKLNEQEGVVEKPLARSASYKKQVIAGRKTKTKVRSAVTAYKVIQEFDNYSLLEVAPKTGRMHQIRVHLTSIGHPIVGDEKYFLKSIFQENLAKRHLLHAKSLEFELFGKQYSFVSELPADFLGVVDEVGPKLDENRINE